MTSPRISDNLAEIVKDYLEHQHGLSGVAFEIALMPTQEGVPMVVIFFWMRGPTLGKKAVGSVAIKEDPSSVTQESLWPSLREFFAQMAQAHSAALSAPAAVPARGTQTASGLFIP